MYCIIGLIFAKRVYLMFSPQKQKKWYLYEVIDVLINLIVIIISQCLHIPNHYIVHSKYTQFYLSTIPHKTEEKVKFLF